MRILIGFLAVLLSFFHASSAVACSKTQAPAHYSLTPAIVYSAACSADFPNDDFLIADFDNDDINDSDSESDAVVKLSPQELSFIPEIFTTLAIRPLQQSDIQFFSVRRLFIFHGVFRL